MSNVPLFVGLRELRQLVIAVSFSSARRRDRAELDLKARNCRADH